MLAAVVVGTALGLAFGLGDAPERLVVPALIGLLTLTFAGINGRSFTSGIRPHPKTAVASLGINFGWTPVFAGLLGWLLLTGHPEPASRACHAARHAVHGLVPRLHRQRPRQRCARRLTGATEPILQLVLLPIFVTAFTGTAADVPISELAGSVAVVLGIPLIVTAARRLVAARTDAHDRIDRALERAQPVGLGLLAVAITAIFATHARVVTDNPDAFLRLLAPLAAFFAVTYLIATVTARALDLHHPERITLTMTTLARNSPVALAIATAAFPDRPLIAVALVVGPLIELPVLALTANHLRSQQSRGHLACSDLR